MQQVTQQYKDAVYSPSRATAAKVIFQIVDVTALGDATGAVTGEAPISKKDQIFDTNIDISGKLATFENNYWKLDGTFVLPPKQTESGYQVGWWSAALCGADGVFSVPQVININFTKNHSSIGLTIFFDTLADEYASDFTVQAYDSSNSLINTWTVTGNKDAKCIFRQNIYNYRKLVMTITKWAKGYRRARITEINFGIVEEYTGNELISTNVLEELDPISKQVSSNEFKFTLDNSDKRFNIINPDGIYPYLQRKQKIQPYLGVQKADAVFEYIPMGVYYLNEWKSDDGALTASFMARDMLDIISQTKYRKGKYQTATLYALAVDVLIDAGVTDYYVDAALQAITVTGNIPIMYHREALQLIAIAGMAVVYCDRSGKVVVKQLSNTVLSETIDFDNIYSSPLIKLDTLINTIEVNVNSYNAQAAPTEVYKGTVNISGTSDVWVEYSSYPCQSVNATVAGGTLNSATYYGNAALLNITANGNVTITATGTVLNKASSVYQLKDSATPAGEQTLSASIDNPLITTNAIAANVAAWVLNEYKKRFIYEINWRMNPALECGDIVTAEDEFGENKTIRITKQEFNFAGYLGGKTNGKGGS